MKYALLIARQRSGTGAFGSVLDKHPELKYLGEVFHPDNIGQELNFFTFLREQVSADPENALPDARYRVFESFLEQLAERHDGKMLVVDVKYRSLHHLNGGWRGLAQRPTLLQQAILRKVPILHLTRRNAVQSFVSGRLADANKVWHTRTDDDLKTRSATLNIRQLSNYIVETEREVSLIERWTRKYEQMAEFDYADLFDSEGLVTTEVTGKAAATLGCGPFADRAPTFIKQAPAALQDSIENFDLVEQALEGTKHAWMLK